MLPIDNKKIIFQSSDKKVSGNPKYIYKYIKTHCKDYKLIWIVDKNVDIAEFDSKDFVYRHTIKSLYHQATTKYIIEDISSVGRIFKKRNHQRYIQTWHGGGAFKKCGYDLDSTFNERIPVAYVRDWDYYIASDEYNEQMIRTSTGYNGKALTLGMSRNDILYYADKNELRKKFGFSPKSKIVLYAPTFREHQLNQNQINIPITELSKMKNILFIVRLHPLLQSRINKDIFKGNIIDGSIYSDVQELLVISDILITDYSSIIFDFTVTKRPIIFYAYDLDFYLQERGFYLDYKKDLPGPIVYNQKELIETITNIDEIMKKYNKKYDEFNKKYNKYNDGNATKRLVEKIINGELK
jgi:CDP-glycerol glycerophosphotransferase